MKLAISTPHESATNTVQMVILSPAWGYTSGAPIHRDDKENSNDQREPWTFLDAWCFDIHKAAEKELKSLLD